MKDRIIEAKAQRFKKQLTETFRRLFGPAREEFGDDELIESATEEVRQHLRAEKAARTRKRKKHDKTVDIFDG